MNQHQIDDNKITIRSFNQRIDDLKGRIAYLEEGKNGFVFAIVNYELNCADSAHRDCCGSKPRQLFLSVQECSVSPVGSCVYKEDKDPEHILCLFCNQPEDRK